MAYDRIIVPREGSKITINEDLSLQVPNDPIVPFIEGSEIDINLTPMMKKVVGAAVEAAYGNVRKVHWMEVYWGEKAAKIYEGNAAPAETLQAFKEFVIGIAPIANQAERVTIYQTMNRNSSEYIQADTITPHSLVLLSERVLRDMGWIEAAELIAIALKKTIDKHAPTNTAENGSSITTASAVNTMNYAEFGEAVITEM